MKIEPLALSGVKLITPVRFEDARGYFSETFKESALAEAGIDTRFVQDNQSLSVPAGTVRGLHFQKPPFAQAKLVRVLAGAILDVAVDLRHGSSTYGQHIAVELSAANGLQLLVPVGFAHGFVTRSPDTVVLYKVSAPYSAAHDAGVRWNDPAFGIEWGVPAQGATLSDKDRSLPLLADLADPGFKAE
ncbi:MAG: dTDP-4-dehydrorhamnose 3,5-epimerase [Hyphomicrobiales bacterium]